MSAIAQGTRRLVQSAGEHGAQSRAYLLMARACLWQARAVAASVVRDRRGIEVWLGQAQSYRRLASEHRRRARLAIDLGLQAPIMVRRGAL